MGRKRVTEPKQKLFHAATKLNAEDKKRLIAICEYKDLNVSQVLRFALREYMARFADARRPTRGAG